MLLYVPRLKPNICINEQIFKQVMYLAALFYSQNFSTHQKVGLFVPFYMQNKKLSRNRGDNKRTTAGSNFLQPLIV